MLHTLPPDPPPHPPPRPRSSLRSSAVPAIQKCEDHEEFCYTVWGDTLYVYGGSVGHQDHGSLLALDLDSGTWRLLHHQQELSLEWAEGRQCAQMWAAAVRADVGRGGQAVRVWRPDPGWVLGGGHVLRVVLPSKLALLC
jgi:hypothetical protein